MSATLTTAPSPLAGDPAARRPPADRPTLEQTLELAWRDALASGTAECPVCRSRMEMAGPEAACAGCGSRLS